MPVETPKTRSPAPDPAAARASYYADARTWAQDREQDAMRSRRLAWIVALAATGVAVLEGVALAGLAPLKTVVPYTVLVDRTTGYAQMLKGDRAPTVTPQAALTQSLLAQYVVARETFDIDTLPEQYRKVALWSGGRARAAYLAAMPAGNPASPLSRYPRTTVVDTRIESISAIAPQTALVRFVTERSDPTLGGLQREYWVAILKYRFSGEPMSLEDRLVNPLGFQVLDYRRDPEAAPQVLAPPASADPAIPPHGGVPAPGGGRPSGESTG